jgi:hypothetical protein
MHCSVTMDSRGKRETHHVVLVLVDLGSCMLRSGSILTVSHCRRKPINSWVSRIEEALVVMGPRDAAELNPGNNIRQLSTCARNQAMRIHIEGGSRSNKQYCCSYCTCEKNTRHRICIKHVKERTVRRNNNYGFPGFRAQLQQTTRVRGSRHTADRTRKDDSIITAIITMNGRVGFVRTCRSFTDSDRDPVAAAFTQAIRIHGPIMRTSSAARWQQTTSS